MKRIKNDPGTEAVSPVIGVMLMLVVTVIIAAVVSGFAGNMDLDKKTGPNVVLSEPVLDFDSNVSSGGTAQVTYWATDIEDSSYDGWVIGTTDNVALPGTVYDQHGLTFTHLGGDPIDLKDLQMSFNSNDLGILVDYESSRSQVGGGTSTPSLELGDSCNGGWGIVTDIRITYPDETVILYSDDETTFESAIDELFYNQPHYGYFAKVDPETDDDTIIRTGDQFKVYTDDSEGTSGWGIAATNEAGVTQSFQLEYGTGNNWILSHKPSGVILGQGDIFFPDNTDDE